MTTPDTADRDARRYLLGRLPEEERDALELRLLTDDDTYRAVLAAEDELLDAYARGELSAADRRAFDEHLRPQPDLAERLSFARALQAYGAEAASPQSAGWSDRLAAWLTSLVPAPAPALRLATAGLAVVLLATAGWLAWHSAELSRQVDELQAERGALAGERRDLMASRDRLADELAAARAAAADRHASTEELAAARARVDELETELESARRQRVEPRREPVTASFLLALATRSAGTPELSLPAAADVVRLQLDTAGDDAYFDAFRVRLQGADGAQVWSRAGLAADATTGTVDVELPAELLPSGHYEVLLEGLGGDRQRELVGAYEFDVKRSR